VTVLGVLSQLRSTFPTRHHEYITRVYYTLSTYGSGNISLVREAEDCAKEEGDNRLSLSSLSFKAKHSFM
jgi:hypothetical protein